MSQLLTSRDLAELLANGALRALGGGEDFRPVVKLFTPDAQATWLLAEIDPDDQDRAFGLCDLGLGSPELGWVSLGEIRELRGRLGLPVERDITFTAFEPISVYARAARAAGKIVS